MIMLILACLDVKVQMSVGEEVSWKLGSKTFGPYNEIEIGIVSEEVCIQRGTHKLVCNDTAGDGWHGGYIEIDNKRYCDNFTSGSDMTIEVTIGDKGNALYNLIV